jgi:hypothetical protein
VLIWVLVRRQSRHTSTQINLSASCYRANNGTEDAMVDKNVETVYSSE